MARFTSLLTLAAIFLYLAAFSATARSPPPMVNGEEEERAPEPYPGFYELIDQCLQKMPKECGEQMFSGIIGIHDYVTAVSDSCCEDMVAIGKECHLKILNATLMVPALSDGEREDIKRRDENIWAYCFMVAHR
ncbi:hypothetical protein OROMI_007273 [Orobanche minor]